MAMASRAILSNFFEKTVNSNHPQYLSGLSRALFPTTFLEIAVYKNHICELRSEELFEGRSSQLYTQLMQLRKESLKKILACTGFEPLTSAIPVLRSTS